MLKASVILRAYEHKGMLLACVYACASQSLPHTEYEVIVIDNKHLLQEDRSGILQLQRGAPHVRLIECPHLRLSNLLNTAIAAARSRTLILIEPHCIPPHDWVESWLAVAQQGIRAASGVIKRIPSRNPVARLENHFGTRIMAELMRKERSAYFDIHNSMVDKEYLHLMSGFDDELPRLRGFDFGARVQTIGGRIVQVPGISVLHKDHSSLQGYLLGVFNEGIDTAILHFTRDRAFVERHFPHPRFARNVSVIRTFRLPLYLLFTLLEAGYCALFWTAVWAGSRGMQTALFRRAAIMAHRCGQLKGIARPLPVLTNREHPTPAFNKDGRK